MTARLRRTLSVLALVASDASYKKGTLQLGDPLESLPDSAAAYEVGFPLSLWFSR